MYQIPSKKNTEQWKSDAGVIRPGKESFMP